MLIFSLLDANQLTALPAGVFAGLPVLDSMYENYIMNSKFDVSSLYNSSLSFFYYDRDLGHNHLANIDRIFYYSCISTL